MDDRREIVLYFKGGAKLVPLDIAKSLSDRFKNLGNPLLLNQDGSGVQPLVVFNENQSMMITVTQMTINMIIDNSYFNKMDTIIFDLIDLFDELGISFIRMGLVYSIFLTERANNHIKEELTKCSLIPEDIKDFNVSFFRKLDFKKESLNCWERYISNNEKFNDLLVQFDINSEVDEKRDFNMKYIKEFIKLVDSHIEERTDF